MPYVRGVRSTSRMLLVEPKDIIVVGRVEELMGNLVGYLWTCGPQAPVPDPTQHFLKTLLAGTFPPDELTLDAACGLGAVWYAPDYEVNSKEYSVRSFVTDFVLHLFAHGPRVDVPPQVGAVLEVMRCGAFPPHALVLDASRALDSAYTAANHVAV